MTSLANALIDTVKASVSQEFLGVVMAFLASEGDEWSPEKMARLEEAVAKITVSDKSKKVSGTKGKSVSKTPDMSDRCQGCDWKGGKIKNAWCKKGGEHTFQVDGETVKCCDKHFTEWENVSADPHPKLGVGFALTKGHNRRTGVRFMGFFGVSATNTARRPPIFPGEHYATISGTPYADSFTKKSCDDAMDAASQDPDGKNGRTTGGVYMPSGGWEGATESVKLDSEVYSLTTRGKEEDTPPSSTPPSDDLVEDDEKVDETQGSVVEEEDWS